MKKLFMDPGYRSRPSRTNRENRVKRPSRVKQSDKRDSSNLKTLLGFYPFTLPGTVMFFFSLYSLGRGLTASNYTAVSVSTFFLVFILSVWGVLFFYSRVSPVERIVWKSEGIIDSSNLSYHEEVPLNRQFVTAEGKNPPLFSRYALVIKAEGRTSGSVYPFSCGVHRSDSKGVFDFSFSFRYPGTVSGMINIFAEDIFALVRIKVFSEKLKDFPVLPGYSHEAKADLSFLRSDLVTKHRKYDNDTEKYLMREYVQGDLYRDINWKSSGKIGKLVTRISPGGREESELMTFIYLSGTGRGGAESAVAPHDAYRSFITGKYFREFFYTFLRRAKKEAAESKCEFQVFIDEKRCSVKEHSDFYRVLQLLSSSAAMDNNRIIDLSFLSDIPPGSKVSLFAETPEMLMPALKKMDGDTVSACYLPEITAGKKGNYSDSGNYIPLRKGDFAFSALYRPLSFYKEMFLPDQVLSSGTGNKGRGMSRSFPGDKVKKVEIRLNMKREDFVPGHVIAGRGKSEG
ncbi:MAG: DUF58 domain-containing protein [Spirochaetia bacterium]|jgi:hypothetical protein|nr:DUF58 domain-containing protein [Spirochaetia bacterium]